MATLSRRTLLASASAAAAGAAVAWPTGPAVAQAPRAREGRYLLKGGVVLSLDPKIGDFDRADVLIERGKIVAVRPGITATATIIDASRAIVMPGFVDTHHHFYQNALRNVLGNGSLADYFGQIVNKATPLYRVEDAYIGVLTGALRALDAGITGFADLSQVSNTPEHSDAMVKALKESGARATYAYSRGYGEGARFPHDVERIHRQHFSAGAGLVTLAMAPAINKEQWQLARKHGLRIYSHASGSGPASSSAAISRLGVEGMMGADNVYIHYTRATAAEMKLVKDTGGHLSLAVPIEMAMGHGVPPIQLALDNGIRPSLSSDVAVTMTADMFSQMRTTFTLQRMAINERAIRGEKELPKLLTAKEVVELATIIGANANGVEARSGSLSPGKDADIVMLRTDALNVMPLNNAYGAIVTGMDTSNVDTVMVAGRIVKHRGQLVGVDMAAHRKRVAASRDYLLDKAGWTRSVVDQKQSGR